MCGLEPDDSSGDARQLSSSLITSALPRGYCCLFRIHATKPLGVTQLNTISQAEDHRVPVQNYPQLRKS